MWTHELLWKHYLQWLTNGYILSDQMSKKHMGFEQEQPL
jgi:hypothetical protein